VACFAAGDLYWVLAWQHTDPREIPFPSIADALFLALYPCSFVALGLLVRARAGRMSPMQWLDGIIAAAGVASVASAVAYDAVVRSTGGDPLTVATNLAYPLGDLLLISMVVALAGATGRRAAGTWWILGVGLAIFAAVDTLYLWQVARGSYVSDAPLDIGWPLALVLFATAAWKGAETAVSPRRIEGLRTLAVPAVGGLATLSLIVIDHYRHVPALSIWLAAAGFLGLLVRFGVVFEVNRRMLMTSERDARTDALTGLPNRRELMETLDWVVASGAPSVLALYDLDGFKAYNDQFGHPAGDALLKRLAQRLADALPAPGRAFRIGGDEFCLLTPAQDADAVLAAADAALSETGDGFAIAGSSGAVHLPAEADDPTSALKLVDQRMYANKRHGRASAVAQARDVLLRALEERSPSLGGHSDGVAEFAVGVARLMRLAPEEVERIRVAAELHDVGKLSIPDSILEKPGPLDETERAFMRRHTIVGERILLAAPALAAVAPLVRASHERWDGTGYPDGLAGTAIPLGARIVAVCDAWDAMVTDRTYRCALPFEQALMELGACAGTQFDPKVVEPFLTLATQIGGPGVSASRAGGSRIGPLARLGTPDVAG
jgi:diguanylate cyclase (GGDEF)-like protein